MSSVGAEYRAMSKAVSELTWLHRLLLDLGVNCPSSIPLFCDSYATIHVAKNRVFHERTKHIELDCHLVRAKLAEGLLHLLHTSSSTQLANVFTKALAGAARHGILSKLGVVSPSNLKVGRERGGGEILELLSHGFTIPLFYLYWAEPKCY